MARPAHAATSSLWYPVPDHRHPPLSADRDADVAVVGAGIVGLTVAVLLARAGLDVVVLEGRAIGEGTTGRTTAKASALQGTRYQQLTDAHGATVAATYARAQVAGLTWMRDQVRTRAVSCDWEDRPAVTYAGDAGSRRSIEAEARAASAAGLDVEVVADLDLADATEGGVRLGDQAQLDPLAYLRALAEELGPEAVHERTRVRAVRGTGPHRVVTEHGTVRADHVVVATLLPFVDRGLFFARAEPVSSYLVALRAEGPLPSEMYLGAGSPSWSFRTARHPDGVVAVVGGGSHPTGRREPTSSSYEDLVTWARRVLPVGDEVARWSAHDYEPADGLPWAGPSSPITPRVQVAGGFAKWGMTNGTAAALVLADRILDRAEGESAPFSSVFDTARLSRVALTGAARINTGVARHMIAGWAGTGAPPDGDGRGTRRRAGPWPVGRPGPVEPGGDAPEVRVVCPHLGGVCSWNDGERTWDCPLHGSRFEAGGEVLAGPAVRPLRPHRSRVGTDHERDDA